MDADPPAPDYYLCPRRGDFIHVLAPPPALDSPQGKADLQVVLDAQRSIFFDEANHQPRGSKARDCRETRI
jgi:hypothetical protein